MATLTKNAVHIVKAMSYGYNQMDAVTPNGKVSDQEATKYNRANFYEDILSEAQDGVIDAAQERLGLAGNANVSKTELNKQLGLEMRAIYSTAGTIAGNARDGHFITPGEFAQLSPLQQMIVNAGEYFAGEAAEDLFEKYPG